MADDNEKLREQEDNLYGAVLEQVRSAIKEGKFSQILSNEDAVKSYNNLKALFKSNDPQRYAKMQAQVTDYVKSLATKSGSEKAEAFFQNILGKDNYENVVGSILPTFGDKAQAYIGKQWDEVSAMLPDGLKNDPVGYAKENPGKSLLLLLAGTGFITELISFATTPGWGKFSTGLATIAMGCLFYMGANYCGSSSEDKGQHAGQSATSLASALRAGTPALSHS